MKYEIAVREPLTPVVLPFPKLKSKKILSIPVTFEHELNRMVAYKVVPHANVAADTKRMWRQIYKMFDMYASPWKRLERDGMAFRYREKDTLWYDIVFRRRGGENTVDFYVGTTALQAEKLKRRLENMMHVTLSEAAPDDYTVPEENTVVHEMRYVRHDLFSLETNTAKRLTPIATVLNTIDELVHEGDMARLSIAMDAHDRKHWANSVMWAHEKLNKGQVPQRIGMKQFVPFLRKGAAGTVNGLHALMLDVFEAAHNTFYKSDTPIIKEKMIEDGSILRNETHSSKLSAATNEKKNLPAINTHIRVAAHSEDKLTRDTLAETLGSAISDTAEDNELKAVPLKGKGIKRAVEEMNRLRLNVSTRKDPNVNRMSTDELSKLALQFPDRDLQIKYAEEMKTKYRIEVEVPAVLRTGMGIPLGTATIKDRILQVDMPTANADGFFRAYVFIGGQGAGKDTAIKNFIVDGCLKHNISGFVIDAIDEEGERGMADGIRDALPERKVIDIDLGHDKFVIPMDLTEVITKLGRLGASRFADEMIDFVDLGNHTRARRYLRDAAKASGGSLYNIKRIIEDEDFRIQTIERLVQAGQVRLAKSLSNWGTNDDVASKAEPVLNRLDAFFGNDRLHDIFAQDPHPEVDFAKWMTEGKVVIIRVPNRKLGELATKTLVHWITLKIFMTRMLMSKFEQSNGCFVVFNEPEQYASEGLTKLMGRIGTEGRKERLGSLYAFHHWNKLPKSLQENLLGGGVQQFLFMNDHLDTFKLSLPRFEETIPLEQAEKLPAHHAIVSVRANKELQPAFICKMKPPVESKYDHSGLTEAHAKRFGRPWEELQEAFDDY